MHLGVKFTFYMGASHLTSRLQSSRDLQHLVLSTQHPIKKWKVWICSCRSAPFDL